MTPFRERMNLYRAYREQNPGKNYWDWKASLEVPAMQDGGNTEDYQPTSEIPTYWDEESQSFKRGMPRVIGMSGTDPIGEAYVGGKAFTKGLEILTDAYKWKQRTDAVRNYRDWLRQSAWNSSSSLRAKTLRETVKKDLRAHGGEGTIFDSMLNTLATGTKKVAEWYDKLNVFEDGGKIPALSNGDEIKDYVGQRIDAEALQQAINETGTELYVKDHTDPNTGLVNPFYNKEDDTYGTVQLPDLVIKPEYSSWEQHEHTMDAAAARRGEQYYHDAMQELDAGRRIAEAAEWLPVVGDVMDGTRAGIAALQGDYQTAGMMAGMMFVPNFIQNPGKRLYRALREHGASRAIAKYYTKNPTYLVEDARKFIPDLIGKSDDEIKQIIESYGVTSGLAKDLVKYPYSTIKDLQNQPVLQTFSQRKEYLQQVHDEINKHLSVADRLNEENFELRRELFPDYLYVANPGKWRTDLAGYPINKNVALNSKSFVENFYKGKDLSKIPVGFSQITRPTNQHVSLIDPITGLLRSPKDVAETAVHEVQHAISRAQPDFHLMREYSPIEDAFVPSGDIEKLPEQAVNALNPLNRWVGIDNYNASVTEWYSRVMEYEAVKGKGKHFREMTSSEQDKMIDFLYIHFGGNKTAGEVISKKDIKRMLEDSSSIGFEYGGIVK